MNALRIAQAMTSFDKQTPADLRRRLASDLTLLSRSFGHSREYPVNHIESVSKTLGEMQDTQASVEVLRLQYIQHCASGEHFEAALKIEEALRLSPDNIDIALKFQHILTTLWKSFHELVVKDPTAPALSLIFSFLHERGYLGIEGYLFAANHFLRTSQLNRAKELLPNLKLLVPNLASLRELETINDSADDLSTHEPVHTVTLSSSPSDIASAVENASNLEVLLNVNQYDLMLTETEAVAERGIFSKATVHALYMRAIALSCTGRYLEAMNLIVKLREFSPFRIEYINSQHIICRQLNDRLNDLLFSDNANDDDIEAVAEKIVMFGTMSQGNYLHYAIRLAKAGKSQKAVNILKPQLALMPNDPDVLSAVFKLPSNDDFAALLQIARSHLANCRRLRPFDFRYWSGILSAISED